MATFYILNDPETNALWLVDSETQTIEPLDRDLIASSGLAGSEFIDSIANRPGNIIAADASRSDATGRAHSSGMVMTAGRRNDPSDRAHFFGPASKEAEIFLTVNARDETSDRAHSSSPVVATGYRSNPSERAHSAGPVVDSVYRSNPSERAHSAGPVVDSAYRSNPSERAHSAGPVVASGYRSNPSERAHSAGPAAIN